MRAKIKAATVAYGQTVDTAFRTKITWKHIARKVVENVDCYKRAVDLTNQIKTLNKAVSALRNSTL